MQRKEPYKPYCRVVQCASGFSHAIMGQSVISSLFDTQHAATIMDEPKNISEVPTKQHAQFQCHAVGPAGKSQR
eukprot:13974655-Ditylum_brightwellii.AAC.1